MEEPQQNWLVLNVGDLLLSGDADGQQEHDDRRHPDQGQASRPSDLVEDFHLTPARSSTHSGHLATQMQNRITPLIALAAFDPVVLLSVPREVMPGAS